MGVAHTEGRRTNANSTTIHHPAHRSPSAFSSLQFQPVTAGIRRNLRGVPRTPPFPAAGSQFLYSSIPFWSLFLKNMTNRIELAHADCLSGQGVIRVPKSSGSTGKAVQQLLCCANERRSVQLQPCGAMGPQGNVVKKPGIYEIA